MNNFDLELKEKTKYVENIVYSYCPREEGMQKIIIEAINYSIKAGGKRLRPMLLLETLKLFGGNEKDAYPFMAAIEMIHWFMMIYLLWITMNTDVERKLPTLSMERIWEFWQGTVYLTLLTKL